MESVKKTGRPEVSKELPNRLRFYRKRQKMSVKELADYLGISVVTIYSAELYGKSLGSNDWDRLADLFDVDPRILKGKKNP